MTLDDRLASLEHSGLIRLAQLEPEIEYLFRHALVQDATYASILRQDRRVLHRAVAQSLEAAYPDRGDEMAATLGHHYHEAGDVDQAVHYYMRAGDAAFSQYANCEAESHYGAALNLVVDDPSTPTDMLLHLFERKGRALELMGGGQGAAEVYEQMERIGQERGDETIIVHALMAQALLRVTPSPQFEPERGFAIAEHALRLARDLGDRAAEARTLWIMALGHVYGWGDRASGVEVGTQALEIARELKLTELIAFLQTDLASVYGPALQVKESVEALTEAIPAWRALGNIPMLAYALNSLSQTQIVMGQFHEAVVNTRESLALTESIENAVGIGYSSSQMAEALMQQGYVGEALRVAESGIARAIAMGAPQMANTGYSRLAVLHACMGNCTEARSLFDQMMESIRSASFAPIVLTVLLQTARMMFFCGEIPEVEELQNLAGEMFKREADKASELFLVGLSRAAVATVGHDYEVAHPILDDIASMRQRLGAWGYYPEIQLHRARVLRALSRHDEAYKALIEAHTVAERTGAKLILWRVLAQLAQLEAERGNHEQATTLRREARSIVQFIADGLDDPQLRAGFLAQPEVRTLIRGGSAV